MVVSGSFCFQCRRAADSRGSGTFFGVAINVKTGRSGPKNEPDPAGERSARMAARLDQKIPLVGSKPSSSAWCKSASAWIESFIFS